MIPLFYGEEGGGGGLRTNNRALSLKMSAIEPGGLSDWAETLWETPRYKMSAENSTKRCDEGNEILRQEPEHSHAKW